MTNSMAKTKIPSLITTGLVVVSVIFPILSLGAILLRSRAKGLARTSFQADDWWIVVAWLFTIPLSVNAWTFASIAGVNYYKIDPLKGTSYSLMCILIASTVLQASLASVKISVLLFYKRIFAKGSRTFTIAAWTGVVIVACWGILFFFLVLLEGNPISTSWTGRGMFRYDSVALGLAQSGSSIALDIIVLLYPLPMIFGLHMNGQKKIAVICIFWLGAFCCIAAIVRLILFQDSIRLVAATASTGFPPVYNQSKQFIFMIIEPNASIIAACLPCYGHLFAGGRGIDSVVRSVRSVFSLRSGRGSNQGSGRSWHGSQQRIPSDADGSINLQSMERLSLNTDESAAQQKDSEIRVTKTLDVSRTPV